MTVDLTGSHPCPVPGCRGSAEEHHRVNVGLIAENSEHRRKARETHPGAVDLGGVASDDLLAEITRRLR